MASLWQRLVPSTNAQRSEPIVIHGAGLCCAVGYRLATASAAVRAGVDHFQHSQFRTRHGERLIVAQLPDCKRWGGARLALWLQSALQDCLQQVPTVDCARTAVVWLAPNRPELGAQAEQLDEAYGSACESLGLRFHAASGVLNRGRAGLSQALSHATNLLQRSGIDAVLLAGVDSLLDAGTINRLLEQERVVTSSNSDGFIPGEAAGAVLLKRFDRNEVAPSNKSPRVCVVGHAEADEPGRVDGSVPSRAQGLTRALRNALASARVDYGELQFRCADHNGEAFYAKEAANAFSRLAPPGADGLQLLTLADSVGEVGAAFGPVMLAFLSSELLHPLGPGHTGILHLSDDDGLRAATVLAVRLT